MDIDILIALQDLRGAAGDACFSAITFLGSEIPLLALMCATYWCVNKRAGTRLMLTFFASLLANQFLKLAFRTPRPWLRDARVTPVKSAIEGATGYSFPSGHTANAVAGYGALALGARGVLKWALWLVAALIGFSRLYLGVHTIQDVLVSFMLGIIIVVAIDKLNKYLLSHPRADTRVALAGVALSIMLAAFALIMGGERAEMAQDAFKFSGGALGVMLGWLLERRKLNFETQTSLARKAARLIIGMALLIGILSGLKQPLIALLGERAGGFARYALLGFSAIFAWPFIFTKLKL